MIFLHEVGVVKSKMSELRFNHEYRVDSHMVNNESPLFSVSKMLSQSSPAQKSLSEDDTSGSDAGSEVGLEPETDRFGFILTNGSTAG